MRETPQPRSIGGSRLSGLTNFHVVAWRQRMDDPISEWGQLLAYLPAIRRHVGEPRAA